jgi:hypothetical protein
MYWALTWLCDTRHVHWIGRLPTLQTHIRTFFVGTEGTADRLGLVESIAGADHLM